MLFLPWRNEESLYGSFKTYKEHFKVKKTLITPVKKKYEQYNDVLEEAIEEVEQEELEGVNDSEGGDINERQAFTTDADDYVFFYPDRPQEHRQYDIGYDMDLNVKYAAEVDCSYGTMQDREYERLMQYLNLEQSEIYIHIIEWIQTKSEPLHIFIEGGAGVRKTHVAKAIYQSMERFYGAQPGEDLDNSLYCTSTNRNGILSC